MILYSLNLQRCMAALECLVFALIADTQFDSANRYAHGLQNLSRLGLSTFAPFCEDLEEYP